MKLKIISIIILLILASMLGCVWAEDSEIQGLSLKFECIKTGDILPGIDINTITALKAEDDIIIRVYFSGEISNIYSLFDLSFSTILDFEEFDLDKGYISFRYSFEEIQKFDTVSADIFNESGDKTHIVLSMGSVDFAKIPSALDFDSDYRRTVYANKLKALGVFRGTDQGFELEREPTRLEGLVMLIRLLGKEQAALGTDTSSSVFNDVPSWGVAYTNYTYKSGLTKGIGNNEFGSSQLMDAKSYVTFVLRALGYDDSKGDFAWSDAISAGLKLGLYNDTFVTEVSNNPFLRGHVAELSYIALGQKLKGQDITLIQSLVNSKAVDKVTAQGLGFVVQ